MYTQTHIKIHRYIWSSIQVYIYTYIHIHIHIDTHTYTHIYTHRLLRMTNDGALVHTTEP